VGSAVRNQGNDRGFSHALLVGKLGRSIAHRLLLAGRGRLVFDKDAAATSAFQGTAASVATSLAELVSECDIACLCLPGPAEVEQVMLGGDSTGPIVRPGTLVVDHTTNSPAVVRQVGDGALKATGL